MSEEEYFCTGTQEVLEERGDMIIGAGVGERGCCCHRDDVAGQYGCDKSRRRKRRERDGQGQAIFVKKGGLVDVFQKEVRSENTWL